ncbi:MAG: hypothetical protein WB626_09035 [Bacteroidota bacterium]
MKKAILMLAAAALWGCAGSREQAQEAAAIGVGWMEPPAFRQPAYAGFAAVYDTVRPGEEFMELLRMLPPDADCLVFLGTWCGDSRREVPRFLRIIEGGAFPAARARFYGLDRKRSSPGGFERPFNIERVPTFVFLREGAEIGRIVETPLVSLEVDMLRILAGGGTP